MHFTPKIPPPANSIPCAPKTDEASAVVLLSAKNESFRQPMLNMPIGRAQLKVSDPAMQARIWQNVLKRLLLAIVNKSEAVFAYL